MPEETKKKKGRQPAFGDDVETMAFPNNLPVDTVTNVKVLAIERRVPVAVLVNEALIAMLDQAAKAAPVKGKPVSNRRNPATANA